MTGSWRGLSPVVKCCKLLLMVSLQGLGSEQEGGAQCYCGPVRGGVRTAVQTASTLWSSYYLKFWSLSLCFKHVYLCFVWQTPFLKLFKRSKMTGKNLNHTNQMGPKFSKCIPCSTWYSDKGKMTSSLDQCVKDLSKPRHQAKTDAGVEFGGQLPLLFCVHC